MASGNDSRSGRRRRGMSLASSGLVTALLLGVVLSVMGVLWHAHQRGKIHQMTTPQVLPDTTPVARPGGQDVLRMMRSGHDEEMAPQFASAVLLPGAGMALLQTTLTVPGHGPVPILFGTSEDSLPDQVDPKTFAPRAGLIDSPISMRAQAPAGTGWGPATELIMDRPAQNVTSDFLPDGSTSTAVFAAAPQAGLDGHQYPPSGIETKIIATVSGRGLDLSVSATNHNDTPRALAVDWRLRFAASAAGLSGMSVVPPQTIIPMGKASGTGSPAAHDSVRLIALGAADLHQVYTGLKYSYLSEGPEMQLRNSADGYNLKLTAMTPSIRSLRLDAAKGGKDVLLTVSSAAGDSPEETHTVVAAHETLQWRLRIEAASSTGATSGALDTVFPH